MPSRTKEKRSCMACMLITRVMSTTKVGYAGNNIRTKMNRKKQRTVCCVDKAERFHKTTLNQQSRMFSVTSRLDQKLKVVAFFEIASFYGCFKTNSGVIRRAQGWWRWNSLRGYLSVGLVLASVGQAWFAVAWRRIFPDFSFSFDINVRRKSSRDIHYFRHAVS